MLGSLGEDFHVINSSANLFKCDTTVGAPFNVTSLEQVINHLDVIVQDAAKIKTAQKIQLKIGHKHEILVVPLDLIGKVEADLAIIIQDTVGLLGVLHDPLMLKKLRGSWPFQRVRIHATDKEVLLVLIENLLVLRGIHNRFSVELLSLTGTFAVHWQAGRSQDESQHSNAPYVDCCGQLGFPFRIVRRVSYLRSHNWVQPFRWLVENRVDL